MAARQGLAGMGLVLVLGFAFFSVLGLRFNASASLPHWLYQVSEIQPQQLKRGDVIAICSSGLSEILSRERGYLRFSLACPNYLQPLLKPVAALPGDAVDFSESGFVRVNGKLIEKSQHQPYDSQNRPMPKPETGLLKAGTVWVISNYSPLSWDSRYYGALPMSNILGVITPIF